MRDEPRYENRHKSHQTMHPYETDITHATEHTIKPLHSYKKQTARAAIPSTVVKQVPADGLTRKTKCSNNSKRT